MSRDGDGEIFEFSGFTLDARQRLLFGPDGKPRAVTARAFETLLYLVSHSDQLIEKRPLMEAVWPHLVVEENNLSQNICALRRMLGETPGEHRFIVTIPGRGFRFVAPVRRLGVPREAKPPAWSAATLPAPAAIDHPTAAGEPGQPTATRPTIPAGLHVSAPGTGREGARPWLPWLLGLTVCGICVALLTTAIHPDPVLPAGPARAPTQRARPALRLALPDTRLVMPETRLAILPFDNLSADPGNVVLADGLHEEILAALARRAPWLEIISHATMMTYRAHPRPVGDVARELSVAQVVEGSVRRDAGRVRLTLQLIDARSDRLLWTRSYERALADPLSLEPELADEAASQLSVRLGRRDPPATDARR